jgi:hypothetical protein
MSLLVQEYVNRGRKGEISTAKAAWTKAKHQLAKATIEFEAAKEESMTTAGLFLDAPPEADAGLRLAMLAASDRLRRAHDRIVILSQRERLTWNDLCYARMR